MKIKLGKLVDLSSEKCMCSLGEDCLPNMKLNQISNIEVEVDKNKLTYIMNGVNYGDLVNAIANNIKNILKVVE